MWLWQCGLYVRLQSLSSFPSPPQRSLRRHCNDDCTVLRLHRSRWRRTCRVSTVGLLVMIILYYDQLLACWLWYYNIVINCWFVDYDNIIFWSTVGLLSMIIAWSLTISYNIRCTFIMVLCNTTFWPKWALMLDSHLTTVAATLLSSCCPTVAQ